ncbi:sugar phosphate isomerase/epimerase [Varibaculum cambriense]|uniref:sugar phosphate isomerase/epimerase family protein n=1 Tax=Varibaculum cambriense TaxID=184870 RepID=UPI002908A525|nr:sugar phosphate isomerase/epimerase [Varibaculum cambriense]MDU5541498.1 sugar phosphate isomerase/epimerase [Varibaculum cambriense]
MKIAGAPISWGVCEVPGWGYQMTPERVLTEMKEIGLTATEFGPQGWLPIEAAARAEEVSKYDLKPVGAFFLAIMHDPEIDPIPAVKKELEAFKVAGGEYLILAADSGRDGYDDRPVLDDEGWKTLFGNLDRISDVCAEAGVKACVHPHWGTMIQNDSEIRKMLDESKVALCLDTGHMICGGCDPVAIVKEYPSRTVIVHAKDVHKEMTDKLLPGEITWSQGVKAGMFAPIGEGDIDFGTIVSELDKAGFDGYYVLEQDIMIDEEPPAGGGPKANAQKSLQALQKLAG